MNFTENSINLKSWLYKKNYYNNTKHTSSSFDLLREAWKSLDSMHTTKSQLVPKRQVN